jgi:hypothetical protein
MSLWSDLQEDVRRPETGALMTIYYRGLREGGSRVPPGYFRIGREGWIGIGDGWYEPFDKRGNRWA